MLNSLKTPIENIFIMLGEKCNFNCKYCFERTNHGFVSPLPYDINSDIYSFIYENAIRKDNNDRPLRIRFYGGEPLLYFDKIQEIVKELQGTPNIVFDVVTNGSLLSASKVDFFNEQQFKKVSISWDGFNSEDSRTENIFLDEELRRTVLRLNKLELNGCVTANHYPKQILTDFETINREYKRIHDYSISCNLNPTFDMNVEDNTIFQFDYSKIQQDMTELIDDFIVDLKHNRLDLTLAKNNYLHGLLFFMLKIDEIPWKCVMCNNSLSIDLSGNIYDCHNSNKNKIGSIYDTELTILNNMLKTDCTNEFYKRHCVDCLTRFICKGGCKNILYRNDFCKLYAAMYNPLIKKLLSLGSEI